MATHPHIQHVVGLGNELFLIEERIQELCERQVGGTILISAPKGRGKTALWQKAFEEAKRRSLSPQVVSIDLEDAPNNYDDLLVNIQRRGFLPAETMAAATNLVKAFAEAAVQFPIPWISKFIITFLGSLPKVAALLTNPHLEEEGQRGGLGFGLLKQVIRMASQHAPLLVVIENIESVSTMSVDQAIEEIVQLIRQNLPILLIVTFDEGRLSKESASVLNMRVDVGDAILCPLPALSKDDLHRVYGQISKPVLNELYQLGEGKLSAFQDLWNECQELKLIRQDRRGWAWNPDVETDRFGKLTNGANSALNSIMQDCINRVGNEKLVRLAIGAAALQGEIFCDEVVANVLWRIGLRLSAEYSSPEGHVNKVISLFNQSMSNLVSVKQNEAGVHFHQFRSILFRHYAKSDIPSERRKTLREFTAAALEQIFAGELNRYAWLVILLYEESGQSEHARNLLEKVTRTPSPAAQEWELQCLSEKIRAVFTDANWAAWGISVCNRLTEVNAVKPKSGVKNGMFCEKGRKSGVGSSYFCSSR